MIGKRISLVRAYFTELESAVKRQKKMKAKSIVDIFHLLDCALANSLITKYEHKALELFVKGHSLTTRIMTQEDGSEYVLLGYYELPESFIEEKKLDQQFVYPIPTSFIDMVLAQ